MDSWQFSLSSGIFALHYVNHVVWHCLIIVLVAGHVASKFSRVTHAMCAAATKSEIIYCTVGPHAYAQAQSGNHVSGSWQ